MDKLSIYLNDHLAGATVGVELVKRCRDANEESGYGPQLARLAEEFEADRDALQRLIEELGFSRDRLKVGAGWMAEKFGRLKLNGSLTGYSPLSRLIELEGLFIGVSGKLSMWRNLRTAGIDTRATDLDDLINRAESQRRRLEPCAPAPPRRRSRTTEWVRSPVRAARRVRRGGPRASRRRRRRSRAAAAAGAARVRSPSAPQAPLRVAFDSSSFSESAAPKTSSSEAPSISASNSSASMVSRASRILETTSSRSRRSLRMSFAD